MSGLRKFFCRWRQGGKSDQRGFMLLELLVVIGIIGALSVVAVPKFTRVLAMAHTAKIQADLQVLNAAIVMYQAEKGSLPTKLADIDNYVKDLADIKPPSGKALVGETETEITAAAYTLSDDGAQALCGGYKLTQFGSK